MRLSCCVGLIPEMLSLRLLVFNWFLGCAEVIMAILGALVWSVSPPSATHFPSSRYRILVSPTLHVPFPPLPSPSPSTTPPSNPVVSATCACPGRGRGECEGGGVEGWKLRNVSLFDLRGGVCWFNYLFPPLEIQLRRFGVRNSTCVLGGGEKAGAKYRFPRGCSADTSFLLLSSFLPVALGSVCRG